MLLAIVEQVLTMAHVSQGHNFLEGDYRGLIWNPYQRATRLDIRTFGHGSCRLLGDSCERVGSSTGDVGSRRCESYPPREFLWTLKESSSGPFQACIGAFVGNYRAPCKGGWDSCLVDVRQVQG